MPPSSICSTWIARQVWNPFECAEIPRIACIATGRPIMVSCRRPAQSVQGCCSTISCSNAACASSAAIRLMVAAGTPHAAATASGA
jgi:hypothetical protein